jgi:hypothetical protein
MAGILNRNPMRGILSPVEQSEIDLLGLAAQQPATVNPTLLQQLANQRAASPRPNVTDLFGYGADWSSYLSSLARNFAAQFEGLGTKENFMGPFGLGGLTAFHGSPHLFSKFDMNKVGTGEGAQAYGHGLYFAENPAVAKGYQENLAFYKDSDPAKWLIDGKPYRGTVEDNASILFSRFGKENALAKLENSLEQSRMYSGQKGLEYQANLQKQIDMIKSGNVQQAVENKGALYKVDIPDDQVAKMLDWDKPLSQQPEVLAELNKIADSLPVNMVVDTASGRRVNSRLKGSEFYNQIAGTPHALAALGPKGAGPTKAVQTPNGLALVPDNPSGQAAASNYLRSLGIPGIRYLDQGSRSGGKGTSNFVVFDDQIPKIVGRE